MSWHCLRFVALIAFICPAAIAQDSSATKPQGLAKREAWTSSRIKGSPDPAPPYRVEPAFPALKFEQPLDLSAAPGTERLFVAEQAGRILSFENRQDVSQADLVVDLKKAIPELTAVYSITFHPDFNTNRKAYICYIEGNDTPDGSCVSEFLVSTTDVPTIDPASEREIIRWWSGGHNGCSLKFGPDGFLYISTGDGGAPSPPDPLMAGQDVSNLLSNILRIDVDHHDAEKAYGVPADNPFINMPDVRPEIWAFGFRNPWRMSFDKVRGDLWVGDVGWQLWEMVYRVERGGNYGWPIMEGPQPALPESRRGPAPISPPIVSHPHSEAASITGGFVYHGERLPELKDVYVYGDFQSGKVWGLKYENGRITSHRELAQTPVQLVSFGEDNAGEIYLVDYQRSQQIYQLVPNADDGQHVNFPRKLSETGLFTSTKEQTASPGVTSYEINAAQWADHASADRWMALPGAEPVQIDSDAKWIFPDGAVLAKTVSIEMSQGDSNSVRRLETQVLHREEGAWRPYTYAWNDEQSDAELVDAAGFTRTLQIRDAQAPSGLREQSYRFASRGECQMCHNPWVEMKTTSIGIQSASPLAVSSMQWNTSLPEDPAQNQMTALHGHGWLAGSVAESPSSTGRFANPYDTTAVLEERVRAYLHVNCSHCHQPHAGGSATIDLLHDVKLADAKLIDAKPGQGAFGISAARIVSPGDPLGSVLHYRMATIGSGRMPRIGSEEVDEQAVAMIREWIAQLPASSPPATPVPVTNPQIFPRLIAGSKVERDAIVKQLTSSTRGALELMIWLQQPDLNADVRQEIVALTVENPQAEIRGLFERFVPASQRAKRLGTAVNAAELLAMEADVERGRQLFVRDGSASCKSCHRVNGTGETLGPDLSQIGKKYSPAEMLTHLLEPSRFIDAKYVPYVLETTGGLVHSGLLLEKTDTEIVLKNAQNKEVRVPAGDVESLVSQQKSLMPELLLREMTPQQAADLLAFLTSLRQ
jgi:putative heme-binding domain-containing protein